MKNLTKFLLPISVLCAAAAVQAQNTVIDFSGFTPGTIDGQSGWSVSNFTDRANVVSGGLTYTNGAVSHNGGSQSLQLFGGNRADMGLPADPITNPTIGEARASVGINPIPGGSTFFFSFLVNHNSGDNFLWLAFGNSAVDDNGIVSALLQNQNIDGAPQPRLRSRVRDTAGGQTANGGTAAYDMGNNITRLIVGKVDFGGLDANTSITLWLDPTSLTEAGNAASTHINAGRNMGVAELNTLWIRKGGNDGNAFVDQIMIGDSWEAVVVPEPSTYAALLGLLALGFVAWRRFSARCWIGARAGKSRFAGRG